MLRRETQRCLIVYLLIIISPLLQVNTDNKGLTVDYICVEYNGECIKELQHVKMVMLEGLFSSRCSFKNHMLNGAIFHNTVWCVDAWL